MSSEIGTLGEQLVARWLQLKNYQLLAHNWRCRWGEIDLIVQESTSGEIAFVEVKTRSAHNWDADGLLAINPSKQQKLIQTADLFLAQQPLLAELPCRFDVGLVSYQSCDREAYLKDNREASAKEHYAYPLREPNPQNKHNLSLTVINQLHQLEIGQAVIIDYCKLTLKDYLAAAFD
jgi:putative endonuclease